jgi:hypothetical protein
MFNDVISRITERKGDFNLELKVTFEKGLVGINGYIKMLTMIEDNVNENGELKSSLEAMNYILQKSTQML